jgi:tetratricopeptide (TPR) repeat protein
MNEGRLEESLEETRRAEELDPLSPVLASNMAFSYARLGNDAEAQKRIRKLTELDTAHQFVDFALALMSEIKGDFEAAATHAEEALKRYPTNMGYAAALGFYYGMLGKRDKAAEMLEKINGSPDGKFAKPFYLSLVHAGLRELDEMFRCLDLAFEERSILFLGLRYGGLDERIRQDPRYVSLFERANLRP